MELPRLHDWDLPPRAAICLQKRLSHQLISDKPIDLRQLRRVAGVDVSIKRGRACACVVVMSFPELAMVDCAFAELKVNYPYIPGLLAFREGPALELAFRRLRQEADVYLFDGMGLLHPRRMGIASHMGLWLGRPTIGCGKRHLLGDCRQPGAAKGCSSPVWVAGEERGRLLRTRADVKPIYVSVGHLTELPSAVELVLACAPKYRLPAPIRAAHKLAGERCDSA